MIYVVYFRWGWWGAAFVSVACALLFSAPLVFIGTRVQLTRFERAARLCGIIWIAPVVSIATKVSATIVTIVALIFLTTSVVGVLGVLLCFVWTRVDKAGRRGTEGADSAGDHRSSGLDEPLEPPRR